MTMTVLTTRQAIDHPFLLTLKMERSAKELATALENEARKVLGLPPVHVED